MPGVRMKFSPELYIQQYQESVKYKLKKKNPMLNSVQKTDRTNENKTIKELLITKTKYYCIS